MGAIVAEIAGIARHRRHRRDRKPGLLRPVISDIRVLEIKCTLDLV
jgi:hypothetical protein